MERVAEPVSHHLEAVYFDTPALALAARGITLRRRTGGTDHGWHLKLPATGKPRKKSPAVDVVTSYLDAQISELLTHDPGVRLGTPDTVHHMRSATRRARSALATYRKLFDKSTVKKLAHELKWLARILGRARDAEVMLERLRQHILDLPKKPATPPCTRSARTPNGSGTRLAAEAELPPEAARTYALLLEIEERTARDTETAYRKAAKAKALGIRLRR